MTEQETYMTRCLQLAKNGLGLVYPNPMVGCVIVHNGLVIGEGWHQKAGSPHAEVNAIHSVRDKQLLPDSVLYVNLEPCSHHGRTPPCSDLILEHRIRKVVIGSADSNELVGGKGIERLRKNGVEVTVSVLEDQCRDLNKRFYTYHEQKRPYVILKWAQSTDGFIFPDGEEAERGRPYWITNAYSRQRVHQWRAEEASILVGKQTVIQDDPELTVRDFAGNEIVRIAIVPDLDIPRDARLLDKSAPTIIFNGLSDTDMGSLQYVKIDFDKDVVSQILNYLYLKEIQSLIVEGGARTLEKFIENGLWDEARVFNGTIDFHKGLRAPELKGKLTGVVHIKEDVLRIYNKV